MTEDVLGLVFGIAKSTFSKNREIALRVLSSALLKITVMPMREIERIEDFENNLKHIQKLLLMVQVRECK